MDLLATKIPFKYNLQDPRSFKDNVNNKGREIITTKSTHTAAGQN